MFPPITRHHIVIVCIISILIGFYYTCSIFPLCSDDFAYCNIYRTSTRVENVGDIITSQITHWKTWGGRFIAHSLAQYFLLFDKAFFNIANTACYAICTLLITLLVSPRFSYSNWLVVLLSFWFMMPHPGSSIFWLTGSCNYLWSALFCSAYLYLIFSQKEKLLLYSSVLAIPAGNSHEGIALGVILASIVFFLFHRPKARLYYISFTLFCVGFLLNALAPGNFTRLSVIGSNTFSISDYMSRFFNILTRNFYTKYYYNHDVGIFLFPCIYIFLGILLIYCLIRFRKHKTYHAYFSKIVGFFLGASVTLALCVYTKTIYPRALFGFCFFMYLALMYVIFSIKFKPIRLTLIGIISIWFFVELPKALNNVSNLSKTVEYIISNVPSNSIIKEPAYFRKNMRGLEYSRYMETYGIGANVLTNGGLSKYYYGKDAVSFSLIPPEYYNSIMEFLPQIKHLKQNEHIFIKNDSSICYCLGNRPKKVYTKKAPEDSPRKVNKIIYTEKKYYAICDIKNSIIVGATYGDGSSIENIVTKEPITK